MPTPPSHQLSSEIARLGTSTLSRRQLLRHAGVGGAALMFGGVLAACSRAEDASGSAAPATPDSVPGLNITHFGGPYDALAGIVAAPALAASIAEVSYEAETSGSAVARLAAGNSGLDIVQVSRTPALAAFRDGLLQPLDVGLLSNLGDLAENYRLVDEGDVAGITMVLDGVDLMYRSDLVDAPITSWMDLFRDDVAGRIGLPGSNLSSSWLTVVALSRALGNDYANGEVEEAFAMLEELETRAVVSDPNQLTQLIDSGDILVAPQYSARIANVRAENSDIAAAAATEGVPAQPYDLCIVADSEQVEAAHAYIDFAISRDVQRELADALLATPASSAVELTDEDLATLSVNPAGVFFLDEDMIAEFRGGWEDRYARNVEA